MKYTFKDMLTAEIYESARIMFIFGKYNIFNNLVSDELKAQCMSDINITESIGVADEFGIETDNTSEDGDIANSIDFNTFMDVNGVPSVNGKWFCKIELTSLTKRQKEVLTRYMRAPSDSGVLVIVSNEWKDYKDYLKNKVISLSKVCHSIELSFPSRDVLKALVKQLFDEKGIDIQSSAIDMFILKMSNAYDEYEQVISDIKDKHGANKLEAKDLKIYMKGIEHYIIENFVDELTKPLSSDKTNSKKVLKIMMTLKDEMGSKNMVYRLINIIDECIDYRLMINTGIIPISINYFFNDVINRLGKDNKYSKVKEFTFRRKASLAAKTSLRDWEYIKLILFNAVKDVKVSDDVMEARCDRALYEICTRSVITPSRINNIIGIDNILHKQMSDLNKIIYNENDLNYINNLEQLANIN